MLFLLDWTPNTIWIRKNEVRGGHNEDVFDGAIGCNFIGANRMKSGGKEDHLGGESGKIFRKGYGKHGEWRKVGNDNIAGEWG